MYESPITQIMSEMQMQYEDGVLKAVRNVGFDVNKEELLKALQYDRGQYEKGYADAKAMLDVLISRFCNMSDEELAEFITPDDFGCADFCEEFGSGCAYTCTHNRGKNYILDWLKSEVKE